MEAQTKASAYISFIIYISFSAREAGKHALSKHMAALIIWGSYGQKEEENWKVNQLSCLPTCSFLALSQLLTTGRQESSRSRVLSDVVCVRSHQGQTHKYCDVFSLVLYD